MQNTRTGLRTDSEHFRSQGDECSVARAISGAVDFEAELGSGQHSTTTQRGSSVLEAEVEQLKAEVAQREREICELKARLSKYEPSVVQSIQPERPPQDDHAHLISEPSVAAKSPSEGCRNTYPTLQRMAMMLESCSFVPPPDLASQPPSQRRTPRRTFEVELEFTEDSQFYAGLTQDISQGGVFIATYKLLPIGRQLHLSFDLPDGTRVSAKGEVRWVRESTCATTRPGMGIAFMDLCAESLEAISKFCRERPPLYMDL